MSFTKKQIETIHTANLTIQTINNHDHQRKQLNYEVICRDTQEMFRSLITAKANYIQTLTNKLAMSPYALDEEHPETKNQQFRIHQLKTELVLLNTQLKLQSYFLDELEFVRSRLNYWVRSADKLYKSYDTLHQCYMFDLDTNNEILNLLITKNTPHNEQ